MTGARSRDGGPISACLKRAVKSRALERAFAAPLPPEVLSELEAQLAERGPGDG
jgi:hypothetical protein